MKEKWKSIPGFPQYRVSSLGDVYSRKMQASMSLRTNSGGYRQMVFSRNGVKFTKMLSHLVIQAFGAEKDFRALRRGTKRVMYKDGNPGNCAFRNLKVMTRSEIAHLHGKNGQRKMDLGKATALRGKYAFGNVSQRELADEYGLSVGMVHAILSNRRWAA